MLGTQISSEILEFSGPCPTKGITYKCRIKRPCQVIYISRTPSPLLWNTVLRIPHGSLFPSINLRLCHLHTTLSQPTNSRPRPFRWGYPTESVRDFSCDNGSRSYNSAFHRISRKTHTHPTKTPSPARVNTTSRSTTNEILRFPITATSLAYGIYRRKRGRRLFCCSHPTYFNARSFHSGHPSKYPVRHQSSTRIR